MSAPAALVLALVVGYAVGRLTGWRDTVRLRDEVHRLESDGDWCESWEGTDDDTGEVVDPVRVSFPSIRDDELPRW